MASRLSFRLAVLAYLGVSGSTPAFAQIPLLECFGNDTCSIPTTGGPFGAFAYYFNALYPLVIGSAAGITILWALWGGIIIMNSGGDGSKREEGISKLTHALTGLVMLVFARAILHFINPIFFQ